MKYWKIRTTLPPIFMKENNNPCMSNMKGIYIGCMLLCIAAVSSAQTYDVIERRNSWNAGTNVTGIMMDSVTVSYAELYGKNNHGDFRNYYEAGKLWSAGAVAKSITPVSYTHLDVYKRQALNAVQIAEYLIKVKNV